MKNLKKILKNQQGMSLIELVVAAAISVIISAAVVQTNLTGIQGMNAITGKMSLSVWKSTILLNKFNDPNICMTNFSTIGYTKAGGAAGTRLYNLDGTVFANGGDEILGSGGDWKFKTVTYAPFVADSAGSTKGRCDATIVVEGLKKSYGTKQKKFTIPIGCTLDAGLANVQACSASSDGNDTLWTQQLANGADLDYIFRNGNVMIGASAQSIAAPFEIKYEFTDEWPVAGGGSGIKPSLKISKPSGSLFDHALVIDKTAVFGNSTNGTGSDSCLHTSIDYAGVPKEISSLCVNNKTGKSYTVIGSDSDVVVASGDSSVIIGSTGNGAYKSKATGTQSIVLGASNVSVTGVRSVGMGEDNIVSGTHSFAMGSNINLAGERSLAVGNILGVNINARYSLTMGYKNQNNSELSFVGGKGSSATQSVNGVNFVFGSGNLIDGSFSTTIGSNNYVKGTDAFALGQYISSTKNGAMTMGRRSTTSKLFPTEDYQFTAGYKNGYRFYTDDGSTNTEAFRQGQAVYIGRAGNLGIGLDIGNAPISAFASGAKPKLYVGGRSEIHMTSVSTASYKSQAAVYARNNPYNQVTGYFRGVYASVGSKSASGSSHNGYHTGVYGSAVHTTNGSSGRTIGVHGVAGNSNTGYNMGVFGTLDGSATGGVGVFGSTDGSYTSVSSKYAGYFVGDVYVSGKFSNPSDRRLKKNIKPLSSSLEKILKVKGVSFDWKDEKTQKNNGNTYGVIAQDLEKVYPELVSKGKHTTKLKDARSVNYMGLIAPLIEATKEMYSKFMAIFDLHDKRLDKLEKENAELKAQLAEQKKMMLELNKMQREIASMKEKK